MKLKILNEKNKEINSFKFDTLMRATCMFYLHADCHKIATITNNTPMKLLKVNFVKEFRKKNLN